MSKFITVEGGEGVGKSTFIIALSKILASHGVTIKTSLEPGGTAVANHIRNIFANPPPDESLTPLTELFLVSAARAQHVETLIRPLLKNNTWVLCDRFYDSTRVYQGAIGGVPEKELESAIEVSVGTTHPDLTFLLDCSTELVVDRLSQRSQEAENSNGVARFDELSKAQHEKLRTEFLKLAKTHAKRFVVLDASQKIEAMVESAMTTIKNRFNIG